MLENIEMNLVCIRWLDSGAPRGWQNLSEWNGPGSLECVSVGFLFHEDELSKTIIPHLAFYEKKETRQGSGMMVIPSGAIISIHNLIVPEVE